MASALALATILIKNRFGFPTYHFACFRINFKLVFGFIIYNFSDFYLSMTSEFFLLKYDTCQVIFRSIRFVKDGVVADIIVGTDAATVIAGVGATTNVTDGVITVKADTGTAGKTASLRIETKSGAKSGIITVPLEIIS